MTSKITKDWCRKAGAGEDGLDISAGGIRPRQLTILMNAAMVRALRDGGKTQTRRLLSRAKVFATPGIAAWTLQGGDMIRALQNASGFRHLGEDMWLWEADAFPHQAPRTRTEWHARLGYQPGDLLYVREAWRAHEKNDHKPPRDISPLQVRRFEADKICCYHPHDDMMNVVGFRSGKLRPGMHMPKAFARTWLRVTEVRVQRVQDISDEDIEAEGFGGDWPSNVFPDLGMNGDMSMPECFARLWDSIYAAPKPRYSRVDGKRAITSYESFPWAGKSRTETHRGKPHIITANPWVAVTVFEKTERPGNG